MWIDDHGHLHNRLHGSEDRCNVVANAQACHIKVGRIIVACDPDDVVDDTEPVLAQGQEIQVEVDGPGCDVLRPGSSIRYLHIVCIVHKDVDE